MSCVKTDRLGFLSVQLQCARIKLQTYYCVEKQHAHTSCANIQLFVIGIRMTTVLSHSNPSEIGRAYYRNMISSSILQFANNCFFWPIVLQPLQGGWAGHSKCFWKKNFGNYCSIFLQVFLL